MLLIAVGQVFGKQLETTYCEAGSPFDLVYHGLCCVVQTAALLLTENKGAPKIASLGAESASAEAGRLASAVSTEQAVASPQHKVSSSKQMPLTNTPLARTPEVVTTKRPTLDPSAGRDRAGLGSAYKCPKMCAPDRAGWGRRTKRVIEAEIEGEGDSLSALSVSIAGRIIHSMLPKSMVMKALMLVLAVAATVSGRELKASDQGQSPSSAASCESYAR